jgi:beta-lactamase superfamily II metal-dependent hydrolase
MMAWSELILVDVGHGNCAIIKYGTEAIVVDAPGKPIVANTLDDLGITSVRALLISHADSDHLSGAIPILMNASRPVKHVYVNPDKRKTDIWRLFRIATQNAGKLHNTVIHPSLHNWDPHDLELGETKLKVLHPTPDICLATSDGIHTDGIKLDSNSMSAVVLIEHNGERICLLAADAGRHSLDVMIQENVNLKADILVFPHHGGHVGGTKNNIQFAKDLVINVEPKVVLFSLGRGVHSTPRAEIVNGVREALPINNPYIVCTQLSKNCASILPPAVPKNLSKYSDGFKKNECCGGTIVMKLETGCISNLLADLNNNHDKFVVTQVPDALCRGNLSTTVVPAKIPLRRTRGS